MSGKLARFFALRYGPAMSGRQDDTEKTASFGFREVRAAEKASLVRGVFDSVASKYDVMNDAMSLGLHRLWKSAMIDWLAPRSGMAILDVAGGTGDIAVKCLERGATVTICDINYAMLSEGRDKQFDQGIVSGLDWICGDAESLPFADASMDAYTIAFGIRNVTRIPAALTEARRVLKTGRAIPLPRILAPRRAGTRQGLRCLFLPCDPADRPMDRGRRGVLSLSRREHPPLSRPGAIRRR